MIFNSKFQAWQKAIENYTQLIKTKEKAECFSSKSEN